ncbi:MAG: glycosyl hydrolase family protein [Arthrospira sp. PLM2.Bin9]|nr:MAG: glycosyl hydrolase family protein [Arthrospira sp. PLM2.Bin9]
MNIRQIFSHEFPQYLLWGTPRAYYQISGATREEGGQPSV